MNFLQNKIFKYVFLKEQKLLIGLVVLSIAVSAYLGFITPSLISNLYASYSSGASTESAIYALAFLFIGEYFVSVVYQLSINKYVQRLLSSIRNKSYSSWLTSLENTADQKDGDQKYPMGEVLSRVLTDTEAVIEMVTSGSFKIFIDFAFILSCLIGFIKLNTISGIALISAEVLACIFLVVGSKQMAKVYMQVRNSIGVMSRVIANLSGGFRFTYFHPQNNYASKKGFESFEDFLRKQLKANIWDATYFATAESLFPILLALLVIIFPYSQITEMAIIATIVDLIQRSIGPIKEVAGKISSIQRARTGVIRIEEFNTDLEKLPKTSTYNKKEVLKLKSFHVKIDKFEYPQARGKEKFQLKNIEINAKPGQLIGMVGSSGCGKSTILKILSTDLIAKDAQIMFEAFSGESIDFSFSKLENLLSYKRQVSIVSQESHIFSSTLLFNITMSYSPEPEVVEFWEKVKINIKYVSDWDIELDSQINAKELSLGEKQLICALRACYLAKPIVLFDEISSGLDSDLEEALKKLVLLIQQNSLTFIVAHRIETIIHADKIIVMDNGEMKASGNHQELLDSSKTYQDFITQLNKI